MSQLERLGIELKEWELGDDEMIYFLLRILTAYYFRKLGKEAHNSFG